MSADIEDLALDPLIDDIVARESDELLAGRDARIAAITSAAPKLGLFGRGRALISGWWHYKFARRLTLVVVVASLGVFMAMPASRYYALNLVGVRTAASLTVLDGTTQLPLKNVVVELGDRTARTNQDGVVKLHDLQLGSQALTVHQVGFSTISQVLVLGLGSNPLGDFKLGVVGTQFRVSVTDYVSAKAVARAEISSNQSTAQADAEGRLVLTLDSGDTAGRQATISADGYRSETIRLELGSKQNQAVVLVPAQPALFVSKQTGNYDVYRMDIDGRNKRVILKASGQEDADISLMSDAAASQLAVVSKRDSMRNQDGYALQALTLVDLDTGVALVLDHSERIQLLSLAENRVVYVRIKAGTSAGNPERYQLVAYDLDTNARQQLLSANNFNDIVIVKGVAYVAASNDYNGGNSQLVKVDLTTGAKQTLLDKTEVWSLRRLTYGQLSLLTAAGTYRYNVGEISPTKISDSTDAAPAANHFYLDAPFDADNRALWTDNRDGKGVLLAYDEASKHDSLLVTAPGLAAPLRWLNARTVLYRIATQAETADYVLSLDGGTAKKITDVTATTGYSSWNYR